MIPKENDMLLNMIANPQFTVTDFQSVGLTGENTNLLSEDKYKASDKIRNHEYFQDENGNFDEAKFHDFYVGAGYFYNQLTTQNYDKEILDQAVYSEDNIWVAPEKRKRSQAPQLVKQANQNLVTSSLDSIGKRGPRTKSISEIAQTQQIYDTKTGEWKDSPNDSFFDNFFDTLVLATYDEDVIDPETGEKIHSKGEYKLNDEGTYYYETLGGRDVYGKQVLNKMNVLTTDGSAANKFDFFDSDDIDQKSVGGTILKNAALVGSMFLPYVGPAVRGLSVLTQMTGLGATFAKLFAGNDNETLNNIQGWAKTVNRSTQTEYAAQNTWCTENFLNMIGDTVGQLAEQRWIFKNAPYLLGDVKGAQAMGKKGYTKLKDAKLKELGKEAKVQDILDDISKTGLQNAEKKGMSDYIAGMTMLNEKKALAYVDDIVKNAQDISSPLAKAYMTGLTVQDTYGEAKAAGASDMEAALLTIGYAAGEAAILNTGLGEWIMPELKGNKLKMEAIAKALTKDIREANEKYVKDKSKKGLIQSILNTGKKIATNQYAEAALNGTKGLQVVGAHALGEAFEETSEELLADFSKSVFNVTRWLRGEEALELGAWEGAGDRYLMSALGGFIGGGLTSAGTDFSVANSLSKMNRSQAMQELIYLVNNGKEKEFLNQVNKMDLGNKHLSAQDIIQQGSEGIVWGEAKQGDNQDLAVKQLLHNEVNFIKNVLEAEGAKISTESLLNRLTLEDQQQVLQEFRLHKLQNTQSMGLFLQNFQNYQNDLVTTHAKLAELNARSTDSNEDESEEVKGKRSLLTAQLKETQEKIQQYMSGNMVPEAIRDAIYEMNPLLSNNLIKTALPFFAQRMYGRKWKELTDTEREEATKKHKEYMETSAKNDIHTAAGIYYDMLELFTPFASQAQEYIGKLQKEESKPVLALQNGVQNLLKEITEQGQDSENFDADKYIETTQGLLEVLGQTSAEFTAMPLFSDNTTIQLNDIKQQYYDILAKPIDSTYTEADKTKEKNKKANEYTNVLQNAVLEVIDAQVQPFIKMGHINPEVKQAMLLSLDTTSEYVQYLQDRVDRTVDDMNLPPAQGRLMKRQLEAKYEADQKIIKHHRDNIKRLSHTPILEYLNQFGLSTTNSDLNIIKHWENTKAIFLDNQEDLGTFTVDTDWSADNEEALNLVDAFIAVVNGMKTDNASFNNPTGYTKILNNIYRKQGVKDFIELAEFDSETADLIIQDAQVIKDRLEFAKQLSAINQGQKLKQQDKVAINKNYLVYNEFKRFVDTVPDDWEEKDILTNALGSISSLDQFATENKSRLTKEEREIVESEMLQLEDAIYDFFDKNKEGETFNADKLAGLLKAFAGGGGFFQKTGELLTENSTSLDKNSFIWWLASRAAVKASDFYGAYKNSITEKIAPIASQELATYLGVAAFANMDLLNSFVDAYRQTVIKEFNDLGEADRINILDNFDKSGNAYSKDLLKYFGGHNVLPQYRNMVFIEGIPGSGKSKGVFSNIINIVKQIDPDVLNGALYVHATEKAAKEANAETGLNGTALERTKFLQWVSSDWKDTKDNIKTEQGSNGSYTGRFLYDDSYEYNSEGQLVNKWKLNQYTDVPKVIFIDEVTHYNQQELSMIEQFARENGIIVLTAGDMDQDTQVAYAKLDDKVANFTINRNNFMRSPKLGVSLRTLNKQMTYSVASTQAAMQKLNKGEATELNFNYLESDPNHKGLYGVKVKQADTDDLSDRDLEEIKKTIDLMLETATGPIGYIYSDPNSKLYKHITTNYGSDKITPYKDSDAQGLEGQYYIVENKRTFEGSDPTEEEQQAYMRSIYTGISRAEQGALVIAPSSYGKSAIRSIASAEDRKFQLESITDSQKKKVSDARKALLDNIVTNYENITLKLPSKQTVVRQQQQQTPGGLPPGVPNTNLPERINDGYTDRDKAQEVLDSFITMLQGQGALEDFIIGQLAPEESIRSAQLEEKEENGITYWVPQIISDYDEVYSIDWLQQNPPRLRNSNNVTQVYNIDDELIINDGTNDRNIRIVTANPIQGDIEYGIFDIDNGTTDTINQSDIQRQYVGPYIAPVQQDDTMDNGLENGAEGDYERAILGENQTEDNIINYDESTDTFDHRVYTFASMEMGVEKDSNGKPKFAGPKSKFDERIDNAIGLMHLPHFANSTYDQLEKAIAYLHGLVNTVEDNTTLANKVKARLALRGNVKVQFAVKSSAGRVDTSRYPQYGRYDIDITTEKLLNIFSDDLEADTPLRKKLVMIVEENGVPVFELTSGILNSPLTLMQLEDAAGNKIFQQEYNTFYAAMQNNGNDIYLSALDVINKHKGGPHQSLIDLFEFWHMSSNGIFYLDEDFNLASNETWGTELIKRKGDYQIDNQLQFTERAIDIDELAENKRLHISSIFSSKDGLINNQPVVKPGHSFVLMSENPLYQNDQALVDQFVKQQDPNYQGKPEVDIYYIVPPSVGVSDWLINQHNFWKKQAGEPVSDVLDLGNDFTAYRILQSLLESGQYDQMKSSDSTSKEIKKAVEDLYKIETKWLANDIQFANPQEKAEYEQKLQDYKEERYARNYMMIREQKKMLQTRPKWNVVTGPVSPASGKTLAKYMSSYLTNIVWFKSPGMPPRITFHQSLLDEIDAACRNSRRPLTHIRYKPQYSKDNVGPFIKIQTRGGKYSLGLTPSGEKANFKIHAKIDTRSFAIPKLNAKIKEFLQYFYFDDNEQVYKLNDKGKSLYENRYLQANPYAKGQQPRQQQNPPQPTIAQQVETEYKRYFDQGVLNRTWLTGTYPSKQKLLETLADKYTQQRGNYGFVYNGRLYLTKIENPALLADLKVVWGNLNSEQFNVIDNNGNTQGREIWFETDANGFVSAVKCRCTNYRTVDIQRTNNSQLDLSEDQYKTIKDAVTEAFSNFRFVPPALQLFLNNDYDEFKLKVGEGRNNNASLLVSNLTKVRDQLKQKGKVEAADLIDSKLLNYANQVVTFNLNTDDIVVIGNKKYKILSVNGENITGLELDANGNPTALQHLFEDSDKQNMKKEEPECAPVTWNLI